MEPNQWNLTVSSFVIYLVFQNWEIAKGNESEICCELRDMPKENGCTAMNEWNKKGNDGSGHIRWSPLPGHNWNNWLRLGRFLKYQPPARQSLLVVTIRLCLQLWCVLRDLVTECGPVGATSLGPFHLLPPRLAGRRLSKNPTLVIRHLSSGQIHLNIEYSTAYKPTLLITCSNSQLSIFFMIDFTLFRLRHVPEFSNFSLESLSTTFGC